MNSPKRFYIILGGIFVLVILLFINTWRNSADISIKPANTPLVADNFTDIPLSATDPVYGNPGAPFTLVAVVDLNNEDARLLLKEIMLFTKSSPTKTRLYIKDHPLTSLFGADPHLVHLYSLCAKNQKKYWPFIEQITAMEGKITLESLNLAVTGAKINPTSLNTCISLPATTAALDANLVWSNNLETDNAFALYANNRRINLDKDVKLIELLKTITAE